MDQEIIFANNDIVNFFHQFFYKSLETRWPARVNAEFECMGHLPEA
jgi:hypothetical protein